MSAVGNGSDTAVDTVTHVEIDTVFRRVCVVMQQSIVCIFCIVVLCQVAGTLAGLVAPGSLADSLAAFLEAKSAPLRVLAATERQWQWRQKFGKRLNQEAAGLINIQVWLQLVVFVCSYHRDSDAKKDRRLDGKCHLDSCRKEKHNDDLCEIRIILEKCVNVM